MNPLAKLSNDEIESRLKTLVVKERQLLHLILDHIKEVDSRKLYLERAYSSLYEYMIKELKYSGSAAMRRIEAARLLREVPAISEKIQDGVLNLTQIGELSRAVKEKEKSTGEKVSTLQKQELLTKITNKTTQETQKELSQALNLPINDFDTQRVQKDESVRLEITLSKEQFEMLRKCKDLASHSLSQGGLSAGWSDVFEVVMTQYLQAKKCAAKEDAARKATTTPVVNIEKPNRVTPPKTITSKTRRYVLQRDKCCRYFDPRTGRVCGSTYALQVDHKTSSWAGGDNSANNLHALCAGHNNLKYRKESRLRYK